MLTRLGHLRKIFSHAGQESGMTLAETLVAVAILGVSAATFITALSTGALAVGTLNEATISQGLAQTQIEYLKAAPYDATGNTYLPISTPAGYSILINTSSNIYPDNQIQKITISVSRDAAVVLTLENYKVNR